MDLIINDLWEGMGMRAAPMKKKRRGLWGQKQKGKRRKTMNGGLQDIGEEDEVLDHRRIRRKEKIRDWDGMIDGWHRDLDEQMQGIEEQLLALTICHGGGAGNLGEGQTFCNLTKRNGPLNQITTWIGAL